MIQTAENSHQFVLINPTKYKQGYMLALQKSQVTSELDIQNESVWYQVRDPSEEVYVYIFVHLNWREISQCSRYSVPSRLEREACECRETKLQSSIFFLPLDCPNYTVHWFYNASMDWLAMPLPLCSPPPLTGSTVHAGTFWSRVISPRGEKNGPAFRWPPLCRSLSAPDP